MRNDFAVLTYLLHLVPVITAVFDSELSSFIAKSKVIESYWPTDSKAGVILAKVCTACAHIEGRRAGGCRSKFISARDFYSLR